VKLFVSHTQRDLASMLLDSQAGKNAGTVKAHNLRVLLHALLRHQPISRIRLARLTGLSTTTVTNLVAELRAKAIVEEVGADQEAVTAGAGRTPLALHLLPQSRCALGIHIGVRRVRLALVDLQANILCHRLLDHAPHESAEAALQRIGDAATHLLEESRQWSTSTLVGVGVGASGLVENGTGVNILAPNLGWRDIPLRQVFCDRLGLPTTVDNNVRCMALAESLYGIGRNARALAFVYARVGVGAGLVVDGEIYRGAGFGAGEIGHWVMMPEGGAPCRCGNSGCLETLISEATLLEYAAHVEPALVLGSANPLQAIFDAAREGHVGLIDLLEDRARYVGFALANLVNALNPQLIMLGGWLQEAFDLIEPVTVQTMRRHSFGGLGEHVDLLPSSFGVHSGVIGAGVLAMESFFFTTH
jgi:predicted NBD/HSP70 family sugar kinase